MSNDIPQFVMNSRLTAEGQQVIDEIQRVLAEVGHNPEALTNLPGPYTDFYVHVSSMHTLTAAQWAERRGSYGMQAVWSDMKRAEAKALDEANRDQTMTDIQAELKRIKEQLVGQEELAEENAQLKKEVSSLKGQNTKLKNKLAEAEGESEGETEDDAEADAEESETEGADDETIEDTDTADEGDEA